MEYIGMVAGKSGDSLTDQLHELGYKVVLIAGKSNEPGMDNADLKLATDLDNHQEIINYFKQNGVKFVIMGTGHIKAIQLAEKLELNGFTLSIDVEKSGLAKDKVAFKRKLEEMGYATPQYMSFMEDYDLNEIVSKIGLPCVVKSSIDTLLPQKASNAEELDNAIKEVVATGAEVLVEGFIRGNDLTVGVVCDGKNTKALGVVYYSKAKEVKLKGFEDAYTERLPKAFEEQLMNISEEVVKNLNIIGTSRLDFIIENEIPYILELNSVIVTGYTGATYPFFKEAGINLPKEMIENALRVYKNKTHSMNF